MQHDTEENGADYQYIIKLNQNNALQKQVLKRVAVFQASLKVVREEAGSQLFNKDNKHATSQGANCLQEGHCKYNDALVYR